MKVMELHELTEHDVYEFCAAHQYPNHWNANSLYVALEDFKLLEPLLDVVFRNYHYYGPQKVLQTEWKALKDLCDAQPQQQNALTDLVLAVDHWLIAQNYGWDYFWIFGV